MSESWDLIWWVLFLPLGGALVQALFGGAIVRFQGPTHGKRTMGYLAVLPVAASFALAAMLTFQLVLLEPHQRELPALRLFDWITLQSISIPFEVLIDPLAMTMTLVITGVGALIHVYATGYMAEDRDYTRFFTYLNLFIAAMLILVLGNNLALMFIGWEGVGLCSYLLISFWYRDLSNAKAGNKAFIVNRIGDWGLTLGMFLLLAVIVGEFGNDRSFGRWFSFDVFLPRIRDLLAGEPGLAATIAVLFFIGACGKSAQFPLYFWLPDAMAGPTPVSALIHAATMVTAGVFMLNRLHVLFELTPLGMGIVTVVGAFTALFAALVAFGQTDIKKVLAYSTVSQLGFMFVACGVGAFWAGMFHVVTHAFFKALLFLGSGSVILAMRHEQDMRFYGNLFRYLKITSVTIIIGWLAIAGVIPLAGFYSKESILGAALGNSVAEIGGVQVGPAMGWVLVGVAALTAAYMTRLTMLTFFGGEERWRTLSPSHAAHSAAHDRAGSIGEAHVPDDPRGYFYTDDELRKESEAAEHEEHPVLDAHHEPKEQTPAVWLPLVALASLSVFGGLALNPVFQAWLYPGGLSILPKEAVPGEPEYLSHSVLIAISLAAAAVGILYGIVVYRNGLPKSEGDEKAWSPFRRAAKEQFGVDGLAMSLGVEGGGTLANWLWRKFDAGFIDGFFNGIAWLTGQLGYGARALQTGFVRSYAMLMLVGGVAVLASLWYYLSKLGGGG